MSEQKAADFTLIACEIGAYEGIRFIQSPTEPETDHTLLALKANVDAFAAKPERKHITEQARSRSGGIAVTESWYAKRGLMLVTVEEWDARCAPAGPYTPLNPAPGSYLDIMQQRDEARSERDALRAEIARLRNAPPFPPEIERLRELVAEAQASAERMRSAYEMAHAQAMANGTRASRAEAEADRLRRVLHAERQPEVQTKPAFRWSPML